MQHVPDLPPEVAQQVISRLSSSGNVARARAVSRAWLAANTELQGPELARRAAATRRADQKWAAETALEWVRGDARRSMRVLTVNDDVVVLLGCRVSRSCPLGVRTDLWTAFTVEEVLALLAEPSSIQGVTLHRTTNASGFHIIKQTLYPLLSTARPPLNVMYYNHTDLDAAGRIFRNLGRAQLNNIAYYDDMPELITWT